MINEIIKIFEQKFNKYAETADSFTSHFESDEDSAIGTLCYPNFNVEFEYCLECGGDNLKSGLSVIVDFSKKREKPLRCTMYDLVPIIDKTNFNCWFYCFIENSQRMELCFDKLAEDFTNVYPKLKEFANLSICIDKFEEVMQKQLNDTFGANYLKEIKETLESEENADKYTEHIYEYLFNLYFAYQRSAFSTKEYSDFLEGDYKKALKKYSRKKNITAYENNMIEHMKSCKNPEAILDSEHECLKDGLKEYYGANGFIPFLLSCLVLVFPFIAVSIGIYYAICWIMYRSVLYASHFELYNALACLAPALLCSIAAGYFLREKIYRKIFRKKFRQSNEYDVIFDTEKSKKIARIFFYLIYILTLVLTFLFANLGVSFTANTINYSDKLLSITNKSYYYNEVENLVYEDNRYTLHFDDGKELELLRFADKESIENEILPILQNNDVEFINNGD